MKTHNYFLWTKGIEIFALKIYSENGVTNKQDKINNKSKKIRELHF